MKNQVDSIRGISSDNGIAHVLNSSLNKTETNQVKNDILNGTLWSTYEFTNNSNYHYSQGNEKKLSDFLGEISLTKDKYNASYGMRFDPHENLSLIHI